MCTASRRTYSISGGVSGTMLQGNVISTNRNRSTFTYLIRSGRGHCSICTYRRGNPVLKQRITCDRPLTMSRTANGANHEKGASRLRQSVGKHRRGGGNHSGRIDGGGHRSVGKLRWDNGGDRAPVSWRI